MRDLPLRKVFTCMEPGPVTLGTTHADGSDNAPRRISVARERVEHDMGNAVLVLAAVAFFILLAGCESAHVGVGIPIPGPVKPSVGVTVNKSGVKGTGGVSAKMGPVPVHVGGSTKSIGTASGEK